MKHIVLNELLAETSEQTHMKNKKETSESMTSFQWQTRVVLNLGTQNGSIRLDAGQTRKVRKAQKALEKFALDKEIYLEDEDYRILFGTEDNPGAIRKFNGWNLGEYTDAYLDAWEEAKQVSLKEVETKLKKESKKEAA